MSRPKWLCAVAAMATSLVLVAVPAPATVRAAGPFTVNTTVDGKDVSPGDGQCKTAANTCSLRAAVQQANASTSATTITLPAGTYHLNTSDPGGYGTNSLQIASNTTIVGASATTTVIVGGAASGVIDIQRFGGVAAFAASLSRLTITGGSAQFGAGVFTGAGVTVSLTDVIIDGNTAAGATSQGGGLYAWGDPNSNLTLTRTTVIRNSANYGGGIVNAYPTVMTINDSTITSNTARGLYAGGIRNAGAMTLNNTTITSNVAGSTSTSGGPGGGGVYTGNPPAPGPNQTSSFTMNGGVISQNSVPGNLLSSGGGLLNTKAGFVTLNRVTVSGNSAFTGGGILNDQGSVTVSESTVSANTAFYGGGAYNNDFEPLNSFAATMVVQRSAVTGNTATNANCPYNLIPQGNQCGAGGGLFNENGELVVVNSTVAENLASTFGAGVYNLRIGSGTVGQAMVRLTNSTVAVNFAGTDGGGILNNTGTYIVKNSIVADNRTGLGLNDCLLVAGSITTSSGNNLRSEVRCPFTQPTDRTGSGQLAPLQNNGGPTLTMLPVFGSLAVGAASNATCAASPVGSVDQRLVARPAGGTCDIGAVEGEASSLTPKTTYPPSSRVKPRPRRPR